MHTGKILIAIAIATLAMPTVAHASWKADSTGVSYIDENGQKVASCWVSVGDNSYYIGEDGYRLHETITPDGYYVDRTGAYRVRETDVLVGQYELAAHVLASGKTQSVSYDSTDAHAIWRRICIKNTMDGKISLTEEWFYPASGTIAQSWNGIFVRSGDTYYQVIPHVGEDSSAIYVNQNSRLSRGEDGSITLTYQEDGSTYTGVYKTK